MADETPWATPDEVEDGWLLEDDFDFTTEQVERQIRNARLAILSRDPYMAERIAADATGVLREQVRAVTIRVVLRVLRNPEGMRQFTETMGPFTQGGTVGGDNPGEIELSPADLRQLGIRTRRRRRAFTVFAGPARYLQGYRP
ncbi:hypothetical protein [Cellulomonas olei]|uniref:hypothetical protein n=1 Tax=Cellulomonas sp. P4 TaxID=3142533 RepID=UPI0031BA4647